MNGTIISEEKLKELKSLARKIEPINKRLESIETRIVFGDRSDITSLNLRIESEKLNELTKKLIKLIL